MYQDKQKLQFAFAIILNIRGFEQILFPSLGFLMQWWYVIYIGNCKAIAPTTPPRQLQ